MCAQTPRRLVVIETLITSILSDISKDESLIDIARTTVPSLIVRSLQPATRPAQAALIASGFSAAQTREIVSDCYPVRRS